MPTTGLTPWVQQQFISPLGTPLSSGGVYIYYAGTNNPAPTYVDFAGTILNTSPRIALDMGGFPDNATKAIYLDLLLSYKFVVKDVDDVVIYTHDNVTPGVIGPQGLQGPQGLIGFQGVQGNQGYQGSQGSQGYQGHQGFQGNQGSQGHQGSQGYQGNTGAQGGDTLWAVYGGPGTPSYIAVNTDLAYPPQLGQGSTATLQLQPTTAGMLGFDSPAMEWHSGSSTFFTQPLVDTNNNGLPKSITGPVGSIHNLNGAVGTISYTPGLGNNNPVSIYWTAVQFQGIGDLTPIAPIQVRRLVLNANLNVVGAPLIYEALVDNGYSLTGNVVQQFWDATGGANAGDFIKTDGTSTTTAAIPFAQGVEIQGPIPGQGGMALAIPSGQWIGPQGGQGAQTLYITNGPNPGSTNSALHLTPTGINLQAGNGAQAESRLKLETGTVDLAAIDNANVLDYLHLGDNNVILQSASAASLLTLTGNEADLLSSNQTTIGSQGAVIINADAETQIHSPFVKSFNNINTKTYELSDAGTVKNIGPNELYADNIDTDTDRLVSDYVSNLGVMGIRNVGSDSFHPYIRWSSDTIAIEDSIANPGAGEFVVNTPVVQISNLLTTTPNIGDVLGAQSTTGILQWQPAGSGPQGAQGAEGLGYKATSTSSENIISSGSFIITINPFLTAYVVGSRVRMAVDSTRWMEGVVYSYNTVNGQMGIQVDNSSGTGTFAAWNLTIAGDKGVQGNQGAIGPQGAQGNQGSQGGGGALFTNASSGIVSVPGNATGRYLTVDNTWIEQVDSVKQIKNPGVSGQAMIAPYASMLSQPGMNVVSGANGYRELVGVGDTATLFNTRDGVIPTTGMYGSEIHNGSSDCFADLANIVTLNRRMHLTGPVGADPVSTFGLVYTAGPVQNVQPLFVFWTRAAFLGTGTLTINANIYVRTLKLIANLVVAGTGSVVYENLELNGFTLTGNASQSYWDNTNKNQNSNTVQLSNAGNLTTNSILFPPGGGANSGATSWSAAMGYGVLSSSTTVVKFSVTIQKFITNAAGNITFRLASYPLNSTGQYLPGAGTTVGSVFSCALPNTTGSERWYSTFNFPVNFALPTNVIIFLEVQSQNAQIITGAVALVSFTPGQV